VVDPRFKGLLSPERYRLAQRGGRLHLPRGNSIRGIHADVKALMHTSRQFAGDTPLGLVAFLGNFQTACDGSGLNEGTAVTLLQYFVTSEVLGVLQRAKDTHASRQLTYKRAVHALLNEKLDGDDLLDHLQALIQASQEKWEDEHECANRILDAHRALGSVLQEAELKSLLLKGGGREVRALGRSFNTQGRTFPKLRKFLAKTGAATREARGVKLQDKPKRSTSRSVGGEEQEPRRTHPAASVALPVEAASAAAALSVTDYGTEAEWAEWAALLAASGTLVEYGSPGDVPVLPVDSLPQASGWQRQPAWGGRPELYPLHTGAGRGRGTLAPGTPVPPRAGTVFPHSNRPLRFAGGGAPPPRGGEWSGHPRRNPRPVGGGPARSVASWGTGCGSAPPSLPRCGPTDARCARHSRPTATGGDQLRRHPCFWAQDRRLHRYRRPAATIGPSRRAWLLLSTPWKRMSGRFRTQQATRGRVPPRSGPRAPTARVTGTAAPATPRETSKGLPP